MLRAQQLQFTYESDTPSAPTVLRDIDLQVEKGSFVALLGHNGSGKSTLAKHFNALLLPTGGKMWVEDMDTSLEDNAIPVRRLVGMVLQNPDNQLVSTVVEEDVAFGPENLGLNPDEIRQRVEESLKAVDMWEYRSHSPHKLSGGQKQRIAIAGILAMHPACLVLDEPTAMLDPVGRREVLDNICKLNREQGMTVVLITHFMEEAALAQRVVVMDDGKILADGTPREVFSHPDTLRRVGLDVPQPTALCLALKEKGFPMPDGCLTPEETATAIAEAIRHRA